jgi:hypothetical protein
MGNDLDEQIDDLAIQIERSIVETRALIEELPEFAPRRPSGDQAGKMSKAFDA